MLNQVHLYYIFYVRYTHPWFWRTSSIWTRLRCSSFQGRHLLSTSPSMSTTLWWLWLALQIHAPQHQEDTSVPHPEGHPGSGPGSCHLTSRSLRSSGWSAPLFLCSSSRMQPLDWSSTCSSPPTPLPFLLACSTGNSSSPPIGQGETLHPSPVVLKWGYVNP